MTRVVSDVEALSELLTSGLDALFHDLFLLLGIVGHLLASRARAPAPTAPAVEAPAPEAS